MPIVDVNGIKLYYETHAPSGPVQDRTPLVLIMGLGLNSLSWKKNIADLSVHRTVITFDNRGTGRSSKPDQPYSLAQMADDTAALLDALHIQRAHVFGFSLGSLIAQELALNYTHRVKSLILGASTAGSFRHAVSPPGIIDTMLKRGWVDPGQAAEMIIPVIYSREFILNEAEQIAADTNMRLVYPTPPYAYRRQLMAAMFHDTYDRLDQLPMPTLLITGSEDVLVVPENSSRLAQRIPYSQLVVLPGAGHYFTSEQPQATCEVVNTFLTRPALRLAA